METDNDFARDAAKVVGATAGYLRSHDFQEMICDAEQAARRNPVPALIGAAALGLLIGVFLRAD